MRFSPGRPAVGTTARADRALGSRYRLHSLLGAGAMGEVWLAHDTATDEPVAAKLLRRELASDAVIVGRFVQERAILLGLEHPNIVRVRDLVVEGDDLAIVMDLVRGRDLRRRLEGTGQFAPYTAVTLVAYVLEGLAEAHARGVLHRDVKPDNVLVDDGEQPVVKLSDFSIARLAQEPTVRMTGVLGTTDYLAPEILTAELVTPAADVYAAGILLHELLTGRPPFAGDGNAYAIAHRHVTAAPPLITGAPPALQDAVLSMLAKDPSVRPTATGAAQRLREIRPRLSGLALLPAAASPISWLPAGNVNAVPKPALAIRGYRPDDHLIDPRRTVIRGGVARPAATAPAGAEAGVLAVATPSTAADLSTEQADLLRQTRIRATRQQRPEVDVPDVPASAAPPPSRRWTWVTGSAVAVAVAAAVTTRLVTVLPVLLGKSAAKNAG